MSGDPSSTDLATIAGRSRLPVEVQKLGGMQRLDWILSLANPRDFVGELAAEEFYLLLRDIGENDAYALLEYASDEQLAAIQDLDLWHGNEMLLPRWLTWVDRALAVDVRTAMRLVAHTEDELIQLLFLGEVRVFDKDVDLDTIPDDLEIIASPDGMFIFTAPTDSDIAQRLPALTKLMWAQDMDRMRRICQAARFELQSAVTEQLLHFRNARLGELGFPSPDEALEIFRFVDPRATRAWLEREVLPAEASPVPPAGALGAVVQDLAIRDAKPPRLLSEALALLSDDRRAGFGQSFTYLVNKVFMALERDLSQTDELPDAALRAVSLTNLGLSWLADDSAEKAAHILSRVWPETCFRVGLGLTLELSLAAARLRGRAGAEQGLAIFGEPVDGMLEAVAARPLPMYLEALDPGFDGMTWRPFATLHELGVVAVRLQDADAVLGFFEQRLGFSPRAVLTAELAGLGEDDRAQVQLATLWRTAVANVVVRDAVSFEPLDEAALEAFMSQREAWAAANAAVLGDAGEVVDVMTRFAERALDTVAAALGNVAIHELDPRYAGALFLTR